MHVSRTFTVKVFCVGIPPIINAFLVCTHAITDWEKSRATHNRIPVDLRDVRELFINQLLEAHTIGCHHHDYSCGDGHVDVANPDGAVLLVLGLAAEDLHKILCRSDV